MPSTTFGDSLETKELCTNYNEIREKYVKQYTSLCKIMPVYAILSYASKSTEQNYFGICMKILFVSFRKGVIPQVTYDCGDDESKLHYQKLARAAAEHDHAYVACSLGIISELSEDMV